MSAARGVRRRLAVLAVVMVSGSCLALVGVSAAGAAGRTTSPTSTVSTGFYLDLGASASVGVQPTLANPRGERTSSGYANDLVAYEATRGVTLQMTQLGCPGETTATMLFGGDHCYPPGDSQLADAMTFLMAHHDEPGIVTIDLGFNNVLPCLEHHFVDQSCARNEVDLVRQQMSSIMASLESAAGPRVTFVGVGHYDPYLADGIDSPIGMGFAVDSYSVIASLNATLRTSYAAAGISMATVAASFQSLSHVKVLVRGEGMVPLNVERACALTWMCAPAPYGPNFHPNDAGYARIARAIEAVLRWPW